MLTHIFLTGSPVINAGTNGGCPTTDQRGVTHLQSGACDIGAHEADSGSPTATAASDNTLTLQPNGTAGVDTRLASNLPNANYGTDDKLYVGESNAGSSVHRSLLRFDLSGIPANATITSATLSLWLTDDFSDNARTFSAYRVKRTWTEDGATWNAAASGSNWNTAGLDLTTDAEGTAIGSRSMTAGEAIPRPHPFRTVLPTDFQREDGCRPALPAFAEWLPVISSLRLAITLLA